MSIVDVAPEPAPVKPRMRGWLHVWSFTVAVAAGITLIALAAATVSGDAQTALARSRANLVIRPPLATVGLRDWRAYEATAAIGYRHARGLIEAGAIEAALGAADPG